MVVSNDLVMDQEQSMQHPAVRPSDCTSAWQPGERQAARFEKGKRGRPFFELLSSEFTT